MANLENKHFMDAKNERRNGSLSQIAHQELEEAIVTLKLAPGEVLSEAALSKDMNIGRTPIREALQRLAREGLIVVLPRKGILVSDINPGKQLLVLEVRRELERSMARTASLRCTSEQRASFLELADDLDRAAIGNDDVAFMRLDKAFNILFSNASHNEFAARTIGLLKGLSRRFWYAYYKKAADLPHFARLHAEVARSIGKGEPDNAAIAADNLVDYTEIFTRSSF